MGSEQLQARVDQITATSIQRWWLVGGVIATGSIATATASAGASSRVWWVIAIVVGCVIWAATQPGSHFGLAVILLVTWQWLAIVDEVTTPRSLVVALSLFAFHSLLALMASTSHTAVLPTTILRRWALRSGWVVAATTATWLLVALLDRRDAPGNALLLALALVGLTVATVLIRTRSLPQRP